MSKMFLFFCFLIFGSQIAFAEPQQQNQDQMAQEGQTLDQSHPGSGAKEEVVQPESTPQRLNDIERALRNIQQQIDRLYSTVEQNDREVEYMDQNLNNIKRRVDQMDNDLDDLETKEQDLSRRLGR